MERERRNEGKKGDYDIGFEQIGKKRLLHTIKLCCGRNSYDVKIAQINIIDALLKY